MIKAVIFDLDDTLLKTRETKFAAIKYAGKHFFNLDITDELIRSHWGKPFPEFMQLVFGSSLSGEEVITKYKSVVQQFKNEAYPDTVPTLMQLFPHYKVCILSSAAQSLVMYDMQTSGLPVEQFTHIQAAEDTDAHKPDPKVFDPTIHVLSKFSISPSEMLYVGDMIGDFQAATSAGLQFRGLADRTVAKSEFLQAGAQTITSISELQALLEKGL